MSLGKLSRIEYTTRPNIVIDIQVERKLDAITRFRPSCGMTEKETYRLLERRPLVKGSKSKQSRTSGSKPNG